MDEPNRKPDARESDKARRLAEALRENLRKRKAQARARRGGADAAVAPAKDDRNGGEAPGDTDTGHQD
jgi:hypothetical protein